jgi:hypothetical protein
MNNTLDYILKKFEKDENQASPIMLYYSRFKAVDLIRELGFTIGAEIGTEHGRYAEKLCRANPQLKLYCIDPYEVVPYYEGYVDKDEVNSYYESAKNRLSQYNCEILKTTSMEAVKNFEPNSLDFVFIDGDHRFEFVVNDVIYWSRIVRPGGVVYGHDYTDQFHVKQAVNAYIDAYKIKPLFVFQKRGLVDTWMFVRQEEDEI